LVTVANISMSRRTIALTVSVVLAAVATIAIFSYVKGLEDEALGDATPADAFVAKDTIPAGTSANAAIEQGLIEFTQIPAGVKPEGAITTLDEIRDKVAAVTIFPQETILAARFVAPGQAGGGLKIPRGRMAMAIEVDIPPGVAGFVRQGDHVSVVAHFSLERQTGESVDISQLLVQDIEVLAVGRRVVTTTEQGQQESTEEVQSRILMTVAVSAGQAERLVFGINRGALYFTLLPEGAAQVQTNGRTANNVLP
jgi:pilus assembly protein CpaB